MEYLFRVSKDGKSIQLYQIKVKVFLGQNSEDSTKVPTHFYGELCKTKSGINLLKKSGHLDTLITSLRDENTHTLDKRIALWAIGNIGRNKKGVVLL